MELKLKPIQAKKGQTGIAMWVLIIAVLLIGVGVLMNSSGKGPSISSDSSGSDAKVNVCDSSTTPTVTINAYDSENTGTSLTETTNIYRKKGENTWTIFTAGTGFEADVGDVLEIAMGINTTDQTDQAYGAQFEYTVPCKESPSMEVAMGNDEIETELTAVFYNTDDVASTAEVFTADQTQIVSIKLNTGSDQFFGNPNIGGNPNVLALALNTTTWDKPEKVKVRGGEDLAEVSCPTRHTATAAKTDYCYELPVITEDPIKVDITLNADATTAPAVDDTASLYAANYYVNAKTGKIESGVEDEENNAAGTDAADTVTLDFT